MAVPVVETDAIMAVDGMITAAEAELLYHCAAQAQAQIVEIGSYRGRSTVALARGSLSGFCVPVYAIDPHEDFTEPGGFRFGRADAEAFLRAMVDADIAGLVRVVELPAARVFVDGEIGLLWIDGNHADAARDYRQFAHQIRFGYLVFHDRDLPVVKDAIAEAERDGFSVIRTCDQMAVMRRYA